MEYVLIGIICVLAFFLGKKSVTSEKNEALDEMTTIAKKNNSKSLKELTEEVKKKSSHAVILLTILCSTLTACTTREFSSIYSSWYTPYTQEELLRVSELGLSDKTWEAFAQKTLANQLTFEELTK
jgi:hypothetical protein